MNRIEGAPIPDSFSQLTITKRVNRWDQIRFELEDLVIVSLSDLKEILSDLDTANITEVLERLQKLECGESCVFNKDEDGCYR